ncbi:hypothetical protein [Nocardia wallacei]|uniref:hypothetical protein n=1 Tax=Nocardia wallacei TaxID=480035 RepID=UPI002457FD5C|nr:hypothetical protein [Nocardia wallacei]
MQKLAIAVLAAGAVAVTLTACDPDSGSGGSELRRNTPATTTVAPTSSERPKLRLPDLRLPRPERESTTSAEPPTVAPN